MDLLKATKSEILEAFENARELGEGQEVFQLTMQMSAAVLIPMRGKNSQGFRLIGSMFLDNNKEPIGKISRPFSSPVSILDVNIKRYVLKLLPCGYWILIAK